MAETLNIQSTPCIDDASGQPQTQEVLLQDQISTFRTLRQEKEKILRKLWEDWENTQFDLISLAAEVLGQEAIRIAQNQDEGMKPGQKEKLENSFKNAQRGYEDRCSHHESIHQDLQAFEGEITQIASETKKIMTEMQQVSVRPLSLYFGY